MPNPIAEIQPARPIRQLLYAVKWVILAFVFISVTQVGFHSALVQPHPIMLIVAAVALVTLVSQWIGRRSWLNRPIVSLITDVALVSAVTYFSDGIQSPFYALYYIVVITAAVDFGLGGALLCAAFVAALSLYIDTIAPAIHHTAGQFITQDIVRTVPFLFLIALITGALRRRLRALAEATMSLRAEQAANEREMEVAAQVQRAQLPADTPTIAGARIAVTYRPAREVGGDLYDFYPVGEDRVGIVVADVSGKGVPAALLLSSCRYAVRERYSDDLSQMMAAVNEHMLTITADETFVTMMYGVLDIASRTFRYINAGHMPPLIVKGEKNVVCFEHSDPPLGITLRRPYSERSIQLEPGDSLVLYTDGVTDALASAGSGIDALELLVGGLASRPVETWGEELLRQTATPRHVDDLTMVVVQLDH